jgi:hypothetical protein
MLSPKEQAKPHFSLMKVVQPEPEFGHREIMSQRIGTPDAEEFVSMQYKKTAIHQLNLEEKSINLLTSYVINNLFYF